MTDTNDLLDASHAWQVMFPPRQPHDGGWLDVGDGHALHWQVFGHPTAPAALVLHGGPGAGCGAHDHRWFDPARWRVVTIDQRGSGRSRAVDPLHANDTPHLLADIEALRLHLGIERWLLFGGSWGATLALAWAESHPQRVSALVLRGVFLATKAERCWLFGPRGAALRHPAAWQRLAHAAGVGPATASLDLLDALHHRLSADDAVAISAAQAWCRWEIDLMDAETTGPPAAAASKQWPDDTRALAQARIGVHYARHRWFIDEGQLLAQAHRLHGLPGAIVQGARDLVTPPAAARALHAAWPQASCHEVPAAGHASTQPSIARALIHATQALAQTAPADNDQETQHVRTQHR